MQGGSDESDVSKLLRVYRDAFAELRGNLRATVGVELLLGQ
jgi:hypothetical protein